jgi:hypothetical protein
MFVSPMIVPLAVYRYWVNLFFPSAKVAGAANNGAKSVWPEGSEGTTQMKPSSRRPPYISARVHRARQTGFTLR